MLLRDGETFKALAIHIAIAVVLKFFWIKYPFDFFKIKGVFQAK